MEITGRLVSDAEIRKTKGNKEFVSFTVAINDYYKTKDGERKELTEYISCTYWQSSKIANNLNKGSVVTVAGRIYLNEYDGKDGKHYANIAFHANNIKIVATFKKVNGVVSNQKVTDASPNDDLPF